VCSQGVTRGILTLQGGIYGFFFIGVSQNSLTLQGYKPINPNFLDSPTNRVLVMPISALQREIILPPHSQLIVPDAMVYDVKRYVFKNLGIRHFRQNYLIC
jgi:hypothetical protein